MISRKICCSAILFVLVTVTILMIILKTVKSHNTEVKSYIAGVVEFAADDLQPSETPQQLILKHTQRYEKIISDAALHGVDILVFPECGLTSINIPIVRTEIPPYLTTIPAIGSNPCDLQNMPQVLKRLSCAARNKHLYLVVNLDELARCSVAEAGCPSDKSLFYNTNIAFDRNGNIIAKYRKYNLFIEPEFNITQNPDHSWFDTDFGVRFGLFICFDILFKEPTDYLLHQNISNFAYSTAWFSELPLLSAVGVQSAWAYDNDVNLLASGYSNTSLGTAGSGIYAGRDGTMVATFCNHTSTKLLIARLDAHQRGLKPSPTEEITYTINNNSMLSFYHENLENYTTVQVTDKNKSLSYVNREFSCNVNVSMTSERDGLKYRLVAFNGMRTYALVRTVYIEVCGILACKDSSVDSCSQRIPSDAVGNIFSNISIETTSVKKDMLSYPITLDQSLLPLQNNIFIFEKTLQNDRIVMTMSTKQSAGNISVFSVFRNINNVNN